VDGFPWANGILTGKRFLMRTTGPGRGGACLVSASIPPGTVGPSGTGLNSVVLSADSAAFLLYRTRRTWDFFSTIGVPERLQRL